MERLSAPLCIVLVTLVSFSVLFSLSKLLGNPSQPVVEASHNGEVVMQAVIPAGADATLITGEEDRSIEPLRLEGRKVVAIPDSPGLWWFCVEHKNVVQLGLIDVSEIVGKPVEHNEDGSYSQEQLKAALTLQVHTWDFGNLTTEKRWMTVEEWAEMYRTNGGDGVISCTPVLEENPFTNARRQMLEEEEDGPEPDAPLQEKGKE